MCIPVNEFMQRELLYLFMLVLLLILLMEIHQFLLIRLHWSLWVLKDMLLLKQDLVRTLGWKSSLTSSVDTVVRGCDECMYVQFLKGCTNAPTPLMISWYLLTECINLLHEFLPSFKVVKSLERMSCIWKFKLEKDFTIPYQPHSDSPSWIWTLKYYIG